MKLITNLLLLSLVVAVVLPFVTLGPNGSALLKPPDLNMPDFDVEKMSGLVTMPKPDSGSKQPALVYKWRDSDGHTHYTTEPPPQGVQSELLNLSSDTNVVPAVQSPPPNQQLPEQNVQNDSVGTVYSPANVRQLIDDARSVQDLLNTRANELQRQTDR